MAKSILSTSTSRPVAESFLRLPHESSIDDGLESVLFEIDADPHVNDCKQKPFADITQLSHFTEEKEVTFMLGTMFLLESVSQDRGSWIVKMSYWDLEANELQPVLDTLRNNQNCIDDNRSPLNFISVLTKFNRDDLAVGLTKRYLLELEGQRSHTSEDMIEVAKCYYRFGFINLKDQQYESAMN